MDNAQQQAFKAFSLYLPYRLNMLFEKSGKIIELDGLLNSKTLVITATNGHNYDYALWNFKPLLIPLSAVKIGFDLNGKIYRHYYDWLTKSEREVFDRHYSHYTYRMIEEFSKYHIDWQKLIERGLAVNKLDYIK